MRPAGRIYELIKYYARMMGVNCTAMLREVDDGAIRIEKLVPLHHAVVLVPDHTVLPGMPGHAYLRLWSFPKVRELVPRLPA